MTVNSLISGPFARNRRDGLTVPPGKWMLLQSRQGLTVVGSENGFTAGERRYLKATEFYLVSHRNEPQVEQLVVPAKEALDEFSISVSFHLSVSEPAKLFHEFGLDVDPVAPAVLALREQVRRLASGRSITEIADLTVDIRAISDINQHSIIATIDEADVRLTDQTLRRHERSAAIQSEQTEATLRHQLEMQRQTLQAEMDRERLKHEHDLAVLREQKQQELEEVVELGRYERIKSLTDKFGIELDPILMRALALDNNDSPTALLQLRDRVAGESRQYVEGVFNIVQSLHEQGMLDDERHVALMNFFDRLVHDAPRMGIGIGAPSVPAMQAGPTQQIESGTDAIVDADAQTAVTDSIPVQDADYGSATPPPYPS